MMSEFCAGVTGRAKETPCHLPMTYGQTSEKGIAVSESPAVMEMMLIPFGASYALPEDALRIGNAEPKGTIPNPRQRKGPDSKHGIQP